VATLVAGCSATDARLGTPIACDTDEPARLILFAQAVPDAELIPCVTALPVGWSVPSVGTRNGEAVIRFDNDAYDTTAKATFSETCPPPDAGRPADGSLTRIERGGAVRFVRSFAGGCVVIDFPPGIGDRDAEELVEAVSFLDRDDLRAMTGWTL
jgi:hypothetical protein